MRHTLRAQIRFLDGLVSFFKMADLLLQSLFINNLKHKEFEASDALYVYVVI